MKKYFDGRVSKGFKSLVSGRTIMMVAGGLLGLFLPIFLYELFDSNLQLVILFYGIASLLYVLFLSAGMRFVNKLSFKRSLYVSMCSIILFYSAMYFVEKETVYFLIPLSVLILTVFRVLFWVPFRTDLALFTNNKNRGRQLSSIEAIRMGIAIFLPLVSAYIISRWNYDVLFFIAIITYALAIIPFAQMPEVRQKFTWSYSKTWNVFFQSMKKKSFIAYFADGAESFIGLFIWPIFIFELLQGNFLEVGILSAIIIGVTLILQLIIGKKIDTHFEKGQVLKWGSGLYSLGWIIKIFIITSMEVFVAGVYHSISRVFMRTPFDAFAYESSADQGRYLDEYTVIMEMAIHAGRVLMAIIIFALAFFVEIKWLFVVAAIAALLLNLGSANDLDFRTKHPKHVKN